MDPKLGRLTSTGLRTTAIVFAVIGAIALVAGIIGIFAATGDTANSDRVSAAIAAISGLSTLITSLLFSAVSVVIDLLRDTRGELAEIQKNTAVLNRI